MTRLNSYYDRLHNWYIALNLLRIDSMQCITYAMYCITDAIHCISNTLQFNVMYQCSRPVERILKLKMISFWFSTLHVLKILDSCLTWWLLICISGYKSERGSEAAGEFSAGGLPKSGYLPVRRPTQRRGLACGQAYLWWGDWTERISGW